MVLSYVLAVIYMCERNLRRSGGNHAMYVINLTVNECGLLYGRYIECLKFDT